MTPQSTPAAESATRTEIETVTAFLTALEDLDLDQAMTYLGSDVSYQNVPFPAARGKTAVESQLRLLFRPLTGFEVRMQNIAANGPIVLTERTDVLSTRALEVAIWVCGTFEVRDGRIVLWRDRFDFADVLAATARGALRSAASAMRGLRSPDA